MELKKSTANVKNVHTYDKEKRRKKCERLIRCDILFFLFIPSAPASDFFLFPPPESNGSENHPIISSRLVFLFWSVHYLPLVLLESFVAPIVCPTLLCFAYPLNAPAQEVGLEDLLLGQFLAALEDAESLGNSQSTVHLAYIVGCQF